MHFADNGYEADEQGNKQYDYGVEFASNEQEYQGYLYFVDEGNAWSHNGHDKYEWPQEEAFQNDGYEGFEENEPFPALGF